MATTRLSSHIARAGALVALVGAACLAPKEANAQFISRFSLRGEGGVAYMFSQLQQQQLGQTLGVGGAGRLGFSFVDAFGIQVSYDTVLFFEGNNLAGARQVSAQQHMISGGLRLEPRLGRVARLYIDANAGAGFTGQDIQARTRFAWNAGLGLDFQLARGAVGIGPFARFNMTLANTDAGDADSHAMYLTAGLALTLRVPRDEQAAPSPVDTDSDGVFDTEDQCVNEPQGANPDPARRGCPLRDSDSDGVMDPDDICPQQAQGEHPDPNRRGCPVPDSDGDGVFDSDDQCVTTPQGPNPDPARRGCPDGDDDNDTVLNSQDQCPREVPGINPDPDRRGCPSPDRDHDLVPDRTDACPDQPGAPSSDARRNGCPGIVSFADGMIRINRPVFFATNRDTILPRSFPVLTAVAETLRLTPGIRHVSIEGHTDDVGDDTRNMDLSQRRANSVMTWLTAHQIDASRLEAHGFGETRPMTPPTGLRGRPLTAARAANRRVDFRVTDPAPGAPPAAAPAAPAP